MSFQKQIWRLNLFGIVRQSERNRIVETIEGHKLPLTLNKIADLLYYDGPFLSLFEDNEEKTYYLYRWCDVDENCNRWLIFRVNQKQIKDYINGNLSMRKIIMKTESYFLCDINNDIEYESVYFITSSQLPESYIPGIKSLFDPELSGISDEDLFILKKRFLSDNVETIKQKKSNVLLFRPTIKKHIPCNDFTHNQSFNKEVRNVA